MLLRIFSSFILAVTLLAESAAPVSLSSLIREADLVVRARVTETLVQRDSKGRIYTEVQLEVSETLKGPASKQITLVHPGGALGEIATIASGQPSYEIEEEAILFLTRNDAGKYVTIGLGNGKFTLENDQAVNANVNPSKISIKDLRQLVNQ